MEADSTNQSKFEEDDDQVQRSGAVNSTVLPPRPCEVRIYSVGGFGERRGTEGMIPTSEPKMIYFHAVIGEIGQIIG